MTRTLIASLATVLVVLSAQPAAAQRYTAPPKAVGNKLDSHLQDLTAGRRTGALSVSAGGRVRVDVYVDDLDAEAQLRAAGMSVDATASSPVPMVEGWLPVRALADVARIGAVKGVVPVYPPLVNAWPGAKVSEGDAAHRAPAARATGATGTGVAVGVMSDSINRVGTGVNGSKATDDLPANVQIVADGGAGSTDEGRAMAEIIYDLVPGMSKLVFATANGGPAAKAQRITQMADAGATVIADDTAYMLEPQFQDGVVSQAIDAVKARGVAYFASAGNQGRASWQGTFNPTGSGDNFHNFSSGSVDQDQTITTVPPGGTVTVFLHWDEPYGAVTTDLDTYFVNPVTHTIVGFDETDNLQNDLPFATMSITNNGAQAAPIGFAMNRFAGTRTPFVKYIVNTNFANDLRIADYATNSGTIGPDSAGAKGALAVAAVAANDLGTNDPEDFSSRGPLRRLFAPNGARLGTPEVRSKPEIAAADRVSTTVPGFATFPGTSAAAPHAAAIAALMKSANPALTVDQIYAQMTAPANVVACTVLSDCGSGFLLADRLVASARRHTVTAARAGGGSGVVTSNPAGIDCGGTCSAPFDQGAVVILRATPAAGSAFAGWSGACSGTADCALTVDAAKAVTATFESIPSPGIGGSTQPKALVPVLTDTTAPRCVASSVSGDLAGAVKSGLRFSLRCTEASAVGVELVLDARTARKLRLATRIGRKSANVPARTTRFTVALDRAAKRRLMSARSVKLRVRITARDAAGNRAPARTVTVALKRRGR
jgi:hypothetical protein